MIKLLICSPTYGYKCHTPFMECLLELYALSAKSEDIEIYFEFIYQESLITRARNTLTHTFLNGKYTHMMFIDSDIIFNPTDVIKMIRHNKNIIVGAYPLKSLQRIEGKSDQASMNYSINLKKYITEIKEDLVEIEYGATGFMMIKRCVFKNLMEKYPELMYVNDLPINGVLLKEKMFAFFDCIIDPDTKRYLSEDYTFCKRWNDIGGKIYLDIKINLTHIGTYIYPGSFVKKMKENGMYSEESI